MENDSNTINVNVVAPPGKLGLRLKHVKEGAKVLCIDNDSPLKSALSEGDVILTLNGEPLVNKNQFHNTSGSRTLGISRQTDTYLRLEAEKLAQKRERDMQLSTVNDIALSPIPLLELQRYNSIAIHSGVEYDTVYVGATPTTALCKRYARFIADNQNCMNIHHIEYVMLHYDCVNGTTGMMKLMMVGKDHEHYDSGLTRFVQAIIDDRHECMRKKKSCVSMLEYLFNTIKIFYDNVMEEK
jgi:hypothetical protein